MESLKRAGSGDLLNFFPEKEGNVPEFLRNRQKSIFFFCPVYKTAKFGIMGKDFVSFSSLGNIDAVSGKRTETGRWNGRKRASEKV